MQPIAWRPAIFLNVLSLVLLLVGIKLGRHIPTGPWTQGSNIAGQMTTWDALWYMDIAHYGYHWNPAIGTVPGHHQNVAFFPLFPMIEWGAVKITGSRSPFLQIFLSLGFGIWSSFAFYGLAARLMPKQSASWATAFFILWPASCFNLMGYPTGLINLFTIFALIYYLDKKPWLAAICCGIGTAVAPQMVFIAAGLCIDTAIAWLFKSRRLSEIPKLIGFGLVSISGLLCFMLYLFFRFHDALAFAEAQKGFTTAPLFFQHLVAVVNPLSHRLEYIKTYKALAAALFHGGLSTAAGRDSTVDALHQIIGLAAALLCLTVLVCGSFTMMLPRAIMLCGWCVLLGYLWFIASTDKNFIATWRLLYTAMALFLVPALSFTNQRIFRYALLSIFCILTILETALVAAGYVVI